MKLKAFAIHDSVAQAFNTPFFMHNAGIAVRVFQDNVNSDDENNISKHPEQFVLFELGEYDDSTGIITPYDSPKALHTGIELKNPTPEDDILKELKTLKSYLANKPNIEV